MARELTAEEIASLQPLSGPRVLTEAEIGQLEPLEAEPERERAPFEVPAPEFSRGAARGLLANAPANLLALAELGTQLLARNVPGFGALEMPENVTPLSETLRTRAQQGLEETFGITEPETLSGRFGERVGEEIGATLPLLAVSGPAGLTARGLAAEGASVAGSAVLGQAAEEAGAGTGIQAAAEIVGGIGGPTVLNQLQRLGGAAARTAARPAARRLEDRAQAQAAEVLQSRVPRRQEAIEQIRRAQDQFRGQPQPTTAQALGREGGQGVGAVETALSRENAEFGAALGRRRLAVEDALEEQLQALRPVEGTSAVADAATAAQREATEVERALWAQVPLSEMPQVSTGGLKEAAQEIVERAGISQRRNIIDEVRTVLDDFGDEIPASELQSLRSQLLSTRRQAQRAGDSVRAGMAGRMVAAVEDQIDTLASRAPGQTDAYRAALEQTRLNRGLYDPRSAGFQALSLEDPRRMARKILGAQRPTQEANRAMTILGNSPEGVEGLRRSMLDQVVGPESVDITAPAAKRALRQIDDQAAPLEVVFGQDGLANVRGLLERISIGRSGTAGTTAANFRTGSNVVPVDVLLNGRRGLAQQFVGRVLEGMLANSPVLARRDELLRQALLDPQLARDLLTAPTPQTVIPWAQRMRGNLIRAGIIRPAAQAAGSTEEAP